MTKVKCDETEVPETMVQNDRDYLNDILATSKQITVNTCIAVTEASNVTLRNELKMLLEDMETLQRENYELAWSNGWYTLEESEKTKINETSKNLNKKMAELDK